MPTLDEFPRLDATTGGAPTADSPTAGARTPGAPDAGAATVDAPTAAPQPAADPSAGDPNAAAAVRLEALGLLAGGVAHDFNNILAVIRANTELARGALTERTPDVPVALADLAEVERAVGRASDLVRQLLAFGRRQRVAPEPLDLNAVLRETLALVRVLVGDGVRLLVRPADVLPAVRADRPQMEQVLVSLVLNGRDAILDAAAKPGGRAGTGTLAVTTRAIQVTPDEAPRLGVPRPGPYACLVVQDDGVGMDAATRARVFEPFFTTKPVDRGAGLGLAATWGIVRQSGGAVHVESEPGVGTTFTVYLPAVRADEAGAVSTASLPRATPPESVPAVAPPADASAPAVATVLLAEDDHAVRRATGRILRGAGYQVLEAGDGQSALALWRARAAEIDLLVADVRMPHLRGDALARAVRVDRPALPVVLMTGFGDDPAAPTGGDAPAADPANADLPVLGKPFGAAELLEHVAASLAAARGDA